MSQQQHSPRGNTISSAKFGLEASVRLTTIGDVYSKATKIEMSQEIPNTLSSLPSSDPHPEADPKISVLRRPHQLSCVSTSTSIMSIHGGLQWPYVCNSKDFIEMRRALPGSIVLTWSIQIRTSFRMESWRMGLPSSLRRSRINVNLEQFLAIELIKLHKSIFHSPWQQTDRKMSITLGNCNDKDAQRAIPHTGANRMSGGFKPQEKYVCPRMKEQKVVHKCAYLCNVMIVMQW